MKLRNRQSGEIKEFVLFDGKEMQSGLTLENLAREWEDYEPKEPLIKDEKIRKAVRTWAKVVGEDTFIVSYNMEHHDCCIYTGNLSNTATIDFGIGLNLKEGGYTIAELCGEEEE